MSSDFAPKPSGLPSAFKPSAVEWKPLHLPAPQGSAFYAAQMLTASLSTSAQARPPRPPRALARKFEVELAPAQTRVLVCESDDSTRTLIVEALESWGFPVVNCANADEALEALERGEVPHLLVTCCAPGRLRGVELARRFADTVSGLETIILSSSTELPWALEAKGTKIHEVILKPVLRLEDVRAAVANACLRVHGRLYTDYLVSELNAHQRHSAIEARMSAELSDAIDLASVIEIGCRGLSELFDDALVVFFRVHPGKRLIEAAVRRPQSLFAGGQPRLMLPPEVNSDLNSVRSYLADLELREGFAAMMAQAGEMSPELLKNFAGASWHTALLETRGIPRGIMAIMARHWKGEADAQRFRRHVLNLAKSYEISILHNKVSESTIQDARTGLANDKYLARRVREEILKASRLRHSTSLLVIENVANAKSPRAMAQELSKAFRATDLVAYRGDGQFAAVLPHTSFVDALKKAESFKQHIESVTGGRVAIGVAEYPGHAASAEELIFAAEEAAKDAVGVESSVVLIAETRPGYIPPFLPETPRSAHLTQKSPR